METERLPLISNLLHEPHKSTYARNSLVIRRKSESQNGCFKKQSTPNFPNNEHFLP